MQLPEFLLANGLEFSCIGLRSHVDEKVASCPAPLGERLEYEGEIPFSHFHSPTHVRVVLVVDPKIVPLCAQLVEATGIPALSPSSSTACLSTASPCQPADAMASYGRALVKALEPKWLRVSVTIYKGFQEVFPSNIPATVWLRMVTE